jgi:hypothetical protein
MFKKLFGWTNKTVSSGSREIEQSGIDIEMHYCPDCGDEYRADITQCASCDIRLISGAEKLKLLRLQDRAFNGRSMDISGQDRRVVLRKGKLRDLKQLRILLTKERIPTLLSRESAGSGRG